MSDESILGLLLRAHAACAAQAHGEEFIHHNASASNCYEQATGFIQSAIRSVTIGEVHQFNKGGK